MASLPVNNSCNFSRVLGVYKDIIFMQVIMPEIWVGDDGVFWEKGVNDLLIPCQSSKFLFCIWLIQFWATKHDQLLWRFQGL